MIVLNDMIAYCLMNKGEILTIYIYAISENQKNQTNSMIIEFIIINFPHQMKIDKVFIKIKICNKNISINILPLY
jgi:hypothetical protein